MKKSCYEVILEISIYLQNQVIDFSKTIFFNFAALNNAIRDEIVKCIETQKKNVISDIQNLLNKEKSRCFTLNPYYSDIILKVKNRILEYKKGSPTSSNQPNTINDISFTNNYLNSGNIYKAHFDNEMGVQNFQISLFAYFKVFEKRFVDYFCLSIFEHFIYYFDDGFLSYLSKKYSPDPENISYKWISESENISYQRLFLNTSLSKMEKALEELNKIL